MERFLCLDIGDKRIGVAVSDPFNTYALPVKTITRKNLKTDLSAVYELYFEKSATSEYFKIRVDGTYTFTPNENKLLYGSCSAADVTLYLKVNSNWSQASAKFSVHYNDNDEFVALTQIGESDVYKLEHYNFKAHSSILFARHDSSGTYTWDTKWNQTSDIVYDGSGGNDNPAKSMYTLNDGWDYCGGSWSFYSAE